ncbi:MAG: AAA family ATPase, partial [Anaerolineae bacterium]
IRREVLGLRARSPEKAIDDFKGLYISEEEVDAFLHDSLAAATLLHPPLPATAEIAELDRGIAALDQRIAVLEGSARAHGEGFRLDRLADLFGLSPFEREVLVICLAAEIDLKYEKLYAYLQDDVTKKRPAVDLAIRLLCDTVEARLQARRAFEPDAPLLQWELVSLQDDPSARRPVLLARMLKLDERIASYLLGSDQVDPRLGPLLSVRDAAREIEPGPEIKQRLTAWAGAWPRHWAETPPIILLHGRYGTGKVQAARFLAAALERPLLLLQAGELGTGELGVAEGIKLAEREALLSGALVCWQGADALLFPEPNAEAEQRVFFHALVRSRAPTILLAEKSWEPARELAARPFIRLSLAELNYDERREIWVAGLNGSAQNFSDTQLGELAARFRLTAGQVQDAIARARTLAWERDPLNGRVQLSDIDAACRAQSQHRLNALARKIIPHYNWNDIVLPRAQLTSLHLICTTVRQRPVVYGEWGFDRKLAMGKGVIALFAGPSGTGKTMAADIIANDLGLDLFKIDLSAVVSKYIGETEKNLERIFGEAQETDAILFFDEADALFGKRSETRDAHDRYANIEIAYLLQRTEEYNGLVILASNIKKNVDEAFVRRLHFTIDFPFPEEPERLEIWRRTFPPEAPRSDDIDLAFLARKFKFAGGNIRNIILAAAFLAAEEQQPISMRHLVRGAGHEFQKMGKLVHESDFEQYFEMVKA